MDINISIFKFAYFQGHTSFIHLFDVIAAPTNAHATDIQRAKQHFKPKTPSRYTLSNVTNIAQRGAITQNIII